MGRRGRAIAQYGSSESSGRGYTLSADSRAGRSTKESHTHILLSLNSDVKNSASKLEETKGRRERMAEKKNKKSTLYCFIRKAVSQSAAA